MESFPACLRHPLMAILLALPAIGVSAEGGSPQWYGQSATRLTAPDGRVIVIDPFTRDNPVTPEREPDLDRLGNVDLVRVPHAHGGHLGETVELAGMNSAPVGVNADFGSSPGAPGDRQTFD